MAYELLQTSSAQQAALRKNITVFNASIDEQKIMTRSHSAIHTLKAGSNENAKSLSKLLAGVGIDVRPILSPTVAPGTERLRVCLHSYNTEEEIILLIRSLKHNE